MRGMATLPKVTGAISGKNKVGRPPGELEGKQVHGM